MNGMPDRCGRWGGKKNGQLDVAASRLITARLQLKAHHFLTRTKVYEGAAR